jgi:hypothetical protein
MECVVQTQHVYSVDIESKKCSCLSVVVDSISLPTIRAAFNDFGYPESFTENEINVQQLEEILTEIFTREHERGGDVNATCAVQLTLNWLLNVYDP